MTAALIGLNFATLILCLLVIDRRDKRAHEEHQADRLERAGTFERHHREVERLIMLVQRPETGMALVAPQPTENGNNVLLPLSDEEMAERLGMLQEIQRMENEQLP